MTRKVDSCLDRGRSSSTVFYSLIASRRGFTSFSSENSWRDILACPLDSLRTTQCCAALQEAQGHHIDLYGLCCLESTVDNMMHCQLVVAIVAIFC